MNRANSWSLWAAGCVMLLSSVTTYGQPIEPLLEKALAGDHRSTANKARDKFRNPRETLLFFGLKPEMTVVEIWPAAGWYAEILAPVLRDKGRF